MFKRVGVRIGTRKVFVGEEVVEEEEVVEDYFNFYCNNLDYYKVTEL